MQERVAYMQHFYFIASLAVHCVCRLTKEFAVYGTINPNGSGEGHLKRIFFAASLRLYPSRGKP